jgi:hypothetical protein
MNIIRLLIHRLTQPKKAQPKVTRIHATVRLAAQLVTPGGEQWQTIELQAEAEVGDPEQWREESRRLLADLEQEVGQRLADPCRKPGNGNGKKPQPREVNVFWQAVYGAGLNQDDGLRLVAQADGDFTRACSLLPTAVN